MEKSAPRPINSNTEQDAPLASLPDQSAARPQYPWYIKAAYATALVFGPPLLLLLAAWDPALRPPGFYWYISLPAAWNAFLARTFPTNAQYTPAARTAMRTAFVLTALLFNPILPISLHSRAIWIGLDLAAAFLFASAPYFQGSSEPRVQPIS